MKSSNKMGVGDHLLDTRQVQSTVAAASQWVEEFTSKLDDEVTLLSKDELDGLKYVGERKQQLLQELTSLEGSLLKVFSQYGDLPEVCTLKQQLNECKNRNQENQHIVMLQLDYTNKGLELLRSMLKMNDLSLYSERGALRIKREKRRIGSA